ncbi:CCA tRNA nucleotidyltransferase [Terrihalobacillus insolitus]|uniref:CCA tRNA nucleotidyltransferase n=1 Tax=Terrihalobacillus insolitus TaxID=2950438 RepID=UPI00234096FC|nr:CCA tRNA nucleotidyltransferase [Terrihalobacillus insolitus]MDC3413030.1 CCA tRNA nucleotidyltransferase [Terrihalobacillus insolitus]
MKNKVFHKAEPILRTLQQAGYEAYIVGGAVRDFLVGRPIGDIDITTSATPEQVMNLFSKVVPIGIKHGTVAVLQKGEPYEITTYRTEGNYSDHRHPDNVDFVDSIQTDLARRDFTINAIAMDMQGDIVDPFHGRTDIKNRLIQTVGPPKDRFKEDPLRMMRAIRFVSQLGFQLEGKTLIGLSECAHWLDKMAVERIKVEFEKMWAGSFLDQALPIIEQTEIDRYIPVFREKKGRFKKLVPASIQPLAYIYESIALFVLLDSNISIETWTNKWKCSKKEKSNVKRLVQAVQMLEKDGLTNWLVYNLDRNLYSSLVRIVTTLKPNCSVTEEDIKAIWGSLPLRNRRELAISGTDLLTFFPVRTKGAWIGRYLQMVERMVVMGDLKNEKTEIKEWVTKWNPPEIT